MPYLLLLFPFLFLFLKRPKGTLSNLVGEESQSIFEGLTLRGCDPQGCGHFGAPRGNRTHKGLDIAITQGGIVKAPFDCIISRIGKPYANDPHYVLIEIEGTNAFKDYTMKLMYVTPLNDYHIGKQYKQGKTIGLCQDIVAKYGGGMVNHYHAEMYKNGVLVNPELYL